LDPCAAAAQQKFKSVGGIYMNSMINAESGLLLVRGMMDLECPLLGVNQTYLGFRLKSEFDSKRDIGGGSQVTVALPITRADGIGAETASSTKREFSSDRAAV
jgi:hypothetical protein